MDRKKFLTRLGMGSIASLIGGSLVAKDKQTSTYDKLMDQVGFNHLPNEDSAIENRVIHRASSRGHADHGWLDTHHTFSFANYYNPQRTNFGVLRVLNDDIVAPGRGFRRHPHDNMEIISIPLYGDLEHKDSMGNISVIKQGDIQVMSAGTGVFHSEYNKNSDKQVKFLQIWMFPRKIGVTPRYDQISVNDLLKPNQFVQVLSPNPDDQGVWVHQDSWFSLGEFDQQTALRYDLKNRLTNGVYAFLLEGEASIAGVKLVAKDGIGVWNESGIDIDASKGSKILLMEVPMTI